MSGVIGVLLAAGAGTRMGRPKALVRHEDGTPWVTATRAALLTGGCSDVVVVLGAQADRARRLVPEGRVVVADDWAQGMSASLRAGLEAVSGDDAEAVLVHLVDLPDVGERVVARILSHSAPSGLARAAYRGQAGHPVIIGRDHLRPLTASLRGDEGARGYLTEHATALIECSDLAEGNDVDTPTGAGPVRGDGPRVGP